VTSYYRLMLGRASAYVDVCVEHGYVGADFDIHEDLSGKLPDDWREFNKRFIPVFMANVPGKTKVVAGLACGMLWTISKGMQEGDVVLTPTGTGSYHVGQVTGPYYYAPSSPLPHRRPVTWRTELIGRAEMSDALKRSTGSIGTVSNVTQFASEIETLVGGPKAPDLVASDPTVEDASTFALEKHLEDFLVANWSATELGKTHRIYEVDGERVGQQYATDTGPIDILAISHDNSELLVVELKRGRASDSVVGQIQRYMGYVAQDLAESGQSVRGVIIALDDDLRIRRALAVAPNIDFYRYEVNFKLHKS
jgi:restriction system protein